MFTKEQRKTYRETHRTQFRVNDRKYQRGRRTKIIRLLGKTCVACSLTTDAIIFHEVHGKKHPYPSQNYILSHIEDFVPMCRSCHSLLHRLIRKTNLSKIIELAKKIRKW
jgi:predicted HNH restriction endonuclease